MAPVDRNRRRVALAGAALVGASATGRARASSAPQADAVRRRRLVVVMLRGAVDGLSVVIPHGDAGYLRNRDEIAIPQREALPLDRLFSLHPALAPLMPGWSAGRLAFLQASGSHDPTRSHFDAQDFMETATPGRRSTPDGWMNRLLSVLGEGDDQPMGLNTGPSTPRILTGPAMVTSLAAFDRASAAGPSHAMTEALGRMHAQDASTLRSWNALRATARAAVDTGDSEARGEMSPPAARAADGALARDAARLGALLRRAEGVRAAFLPVGGWDTHVNQGGVRGALADRLGALAASLDALARGLGDRLDDTVVLVMSEFGRTVRQNGTRGTDHGHGNAMWLLGGPVDGGRVHGEWPGLESSALHEGRDLAVTTDFRQVIAEVLEKHLRLDDRAIARVLPDGAGPGDRRGLLRG